MRDSRIPGNWTEHRREDGERVGWIRPDRERWTAVDVLGREVACGVEWLDAEVALEERGLAFLAAVWMLERPDGPPLRVRMVEVSPQRIVVKVDDFGDVTRGAERHVLAWPLPPQLREARPEDLDGFAG